MWATLLAGGCASGGIDRAPSGSASGDRAGSPIEPIVVVSGDVGSGDVVSNGVVGGSDAPAEAMRHDDFPAEEPSNRREPLTPPGSRSPTTGDDPDALVAKRLAALLEQPVTLEVGTRRARDGWLYVDGLPRDAAGGRIDYASTVFADDIAEGWFDDGFVALLRRSGPDAGWVVLELELGATDASFVDWEGRHGAPPGLVVP